jgi:hypothetical protein
MFFEPRPKPPIAQVESLADAALVIVLAYWRDKTYRPTAADLERFRAVHMHLFRTHSYLSRLVTRLERRFRGEPEDRIGGWKE